MSERDYRWIVEIDGLEHGPWEDEELKQAVAAGTVTPSTLLRRPGMAKAVAANRVKGLFAAVAAPAATATAVAEAPSMPGFLDEPPASARRQDPPAPTRREDPAAGINPFSAPITPGAATRAVGTTATAEREDLRSSGFPRRVAAYLLDYFQLTLIFFACALGLALLLGNTNRIDHLIEQAGIFALALPQFAFVLYKVLCETFRGQTPGKRLTCQWVIDDQGLPPSFKQILIRNQIWVLALVMPLAMPLVAMSAVNGGRIGQILFACFAVGYWLYTIVGYLMGAFGRTNRTLFDRLAGTRVVLALDRPW